MTRPALFGDERYEDGARRAAEANRWLVVDATAAWCQPCKLMDRTTWSDPAVAEWIAAHAVAVQVDVDADPDLARQLTVAAMPTVIAFRGGQERDRVVGFRNAQQLLEWLNGLDGGESSIERMRRLLPATGEDVQGRMELARALLHARRFDEALEEYVWLWNNMTRLDPSMVGVRASFMAQEMGALAAEHPPAHTRFGALRDEAGAEADRADAPPERRLDWVVLNEVLDDDARTLTWLETAIGRPEHGALLDNLAHRLVPKLRARGRWADIGRLYSDPLPHLVNAHDMIAPEGLPAEMLAQIREVMSGHFREEAAVMVAGLRAAGRLDEAAAVEAEARRRDPGEAMNEAIARELAESQAAVSPR